MYASSPYGGLVRNVILLNSVFIGRLQFKLKDKYGVIKLLLDINFEFFDGVILVFILLVSGASFILVLEAYLQPVKYL